MSIRAGLQLSPALLFWQSTRFRLALLSPAHSH